MAIAPIGTLVQNIDSLLLSSMDGIVTSVASQVAAPLAVSMVAYLGVLGLKYSAGETSWEQVFFTVLRFGVLLWLATNVTIFNYYVKGILFVSLPSTMATAVTSTGSVSVGSLTGAAAAFDTVWLQCWALAGEGWEAISWTGSGTGAALLGAAAATISSAGIVILAVAYEGARAVEGIVICLGPALIACGLFPATRGFLENAIGKVVALIVLQALVIITLQIVLSGETSAMTSLLSAGDASASGASFAEHLQALGAMTTMLLFGALLVATMVPVAYSIGSGVSIGNPAGAATRAVFLAARGAGSLLSGGGGGGSSPSPSLPPISMNTPSSLPPPSPPPSIASRS